MVAQRTVILSRSGPEKGNQSCSVWSTFLALWGFDVDCACYSKYLSERDWKSFERIFAGFGIQKRILYGTFSELARRHVNQQGDVRVGTQALVEGISQPSAHGGKAKRPNILHIDEVDVFFARDFYGALYHPSVLVPLQGIKELLTFIWENKGPTLTAHQVQESEAYKNVEQLHFPRLKPLIDLQIVAMVRASSTYNDPEHSYEMQDGRIGYKEHGSVNTTFRHGYNTMFCYFKEHERNSVTKEVFDSNLGLDIRCGSFSYAEIPLGYQRILGVTGTLASLGEFEQNIIRNEYKIQGRTLTPSIYGKRDAKFDLGVHMEKGRDAYYRKILDEITDVVTAERAALVFFENEDAITAFKNSEYGLRLNNAEVVTAGNVEFINHYVRQATRSKEVTFFPRVFGRGLDFMCYDKTVMARGGVAVIQTFFSEEFAEEIQIKGRTCRQGDKGTYKMVLLAEEILRWNQTKVGAQIVNETLVTMDEMDQAADLYKLLDAKRVERARTVAKVRQDAVGRAEAGHAFSV